MASPPFRFKKFSIEQEGVAHPVGTDSVLLGAWADVRACHRILDVGTGTGIVALMLAQRLFENGENDLSAPAGQVIAGVEIHPPSAACARRNFAASPWAEHLRVEEGPVQEFARNSPLKFDLIASNPPYFSENTVSPYEPRRLGRNTATLSSDDLLEVADILLSPTGRLCIILPFAAGKRLCERAVPLGWYCTEEVEVRTRPHKTPERLLLRFEKDPYRFDRKGLVVCSENNLYTPEFQEITKMFYLD